jgi:hypothetical protein
VVQALLDELPVQHRLLLLLVVLLVVVVLSVGRVGCRWRAAAEHALQLLQYGCGLLAPTAGREEGVLAAQPGGGHQEHASCVATVAAATAESAACPEGPAAIQGVFGCLS